MNEDFGTIRAITQLEFDDFGACMKDADDDGAKKKALSAADVRQIELAAKTILKDKLEDGLEVSWADLYEDFIAAHVPWRIAVFVAWSSMPKTRRIPRTQHELATEYLGLTGPRQFSAWRKKYPEIDMMIADAQAHELRDARADVFFALKTMASSVDYKARGDRRLYLEMTGDYVPTTKLEAALKKIGVSKDDLAGMTDAQLAEIGRAAKEKLSEGNEGEEATE